MMMLDMHSSAWKAIYEGIRRDFYHNRAGMTRDDMEAHLRTLDIVLHKDSDGRWEWFAQLPCTQHNKMILRHHSNL